MGSIESLKTAKTVVIYDLERKKEYRKKGNKMCVILSEKEIYYCRQYSKLFRRREPDNTDLIARFED